MLLTLNISITIKLKTVHLATMVFPRLAINVALAVFVNTKFLNQIADTRIVPSSKRPHLTFCWTGSTRPSLLLSHFIFLSFKEYQSRIC
mgnify:CR=1 FL=1